MQKTAEEILEGHGFGILQFMDSDDLTTLLVVIKEYARQEAELAFEAGALYGSDKTAASEWGLRVTEQNQEQYINERFK